MTIPPEVTPEGVYEYLKTLPKPTLVRCSDEIRQWFLDAALPLLKDQALSELRRKNVFAPRLVAFRDNGGMAIVDVEEAYGGEWGDQDSKDRTAYVHKVGAMVPSVKASVFCVETWVLKGPTEQDMSRSLKDHPDRGEAMMFSMIHYDQPNNAIMQLSAMVEVIKVLGHNTSPAAWADTEYGNTMISDPLGDDDMRIEGRFVHE